jgi:Ca2+-binding EF-hand superfamily protein
MPIHDKIVDQVYNKYNINGNGTLSEKQTETFLNEVLQKMGHSGQLSHMKFKGLFKYFDKDGNGTISKDEIESLVAKAVPGGN